MYSQNFKLICVSNRHLNNDFLSDARRIVTEKKPDIFVLREKDLDIVEYENLATDVSKILNDSGCELTLHTHFKLAKKLGASSVHFGFDDFVQLKKSGENFGEFKSVGVSIHSLLQAQKAQDLGASYVFAGHIFNTLSHAGKVGRGLSFLEQICKLNITTYAIGGINFKNLELIKKTGANGACMMREFLK